MKKKSLCLSLCLALLLSMLSPSALALSADPSPTATATVSYAAEGNTVDVCISLAHNPGIITMILEVGYDASALTLVKVTDAGVLGTAMHTDNLLLDPYQLTWNNGTAPSDFTSVGQIAVLTFAVKATAKDGTYPITLASSGTLNYDLDEVPFTTIGCSVRIKGGAPVSDEEHHYDFSGKCTVCGHSCPVSCDAAAAVVTLSSTPDAAKCIWIAAYRDGQLLSIIPGAKGTNPLAVLQADEIRVFYLGTDLCPVSEMHRLYSE